jgi:hypothetical protein
LNDQSSIEVPEDAPVFASDPTPTVTASRDAPADEAVRTFSEVLDTSTHGLRPAHGLAGGVEAALEVALGNAATALEESLVEVEGAGVGVGDVAGPGHAARKRPPDRPTSAHDDARRDRDRMTAQGIE